MKNFWFFVIFALCAALPASAQQPGCTTLSLTIGCYVYPQGILQVPQILPDGTSSTPSLAWNNSPSTGIWRNPTGNVLGFTFAGTPGGNWSSTGINGVNIGAVAPGTGYFTTLSGNTRLFEPVWTSATRPGTPQTGEMGWNTDLGLIDWWNGSAWINPTSSTGFLPSTPVAAGYVIANATGSTATPTGAALTSLLDQVFGGTQGAVVYRGASVWSALAPGTSGYYLKSNGAGANPAWSAQSNHAIAALQWSSGLTVSAATFNLVTSWPWSTGTVQSVSYVTNGTTPSFTVQISINGTPVTGCNAITVTSSTVATTTCTGSNTIASGGLLQAVVSSVTGTPNLASVQVNYVHSEP